MRTRAAIALTIALAGLVATPAGTASAAEGSGSCFLESAAGVSAGVGSALSIEESPAGPITRSESCSAPRVQPLTHWSRVTSPFGMRVHPITGAYTMHWGTDFSRSGIRGTPILSIADGTVITSIESYSTSGAGNTIVIQHADGVRSQYMHMGAKSPIPVGGAVRAGQMIGVVGTTGSSTGPHLHLEVWSNGARVDPVAFLAGAPFLR